MIRRGLDHGNTNLHIKWQDDDDVGFALRGLISMRAQIDPAGMSSSTSLSTSSLSSSSRPSFFLVILWFNS